MGGHLQGSDPSRAYRGQQAVLTLFFRPILAFSRARARLRSRPRPGWAIRKVEIFARDHGRCRICGTWAVDVHHIENRSHFGKKRYHVADSPDNLISVCRFCHNWITFGNSTGRLVVTALDEGKIHSEVKAWR